MPCYPYICDVCGTTAEEMVPMSQYQGEIECPYCDDGTMMRREFAGTTPHTLDHPFQHPIEMFSIAPNNPTELAAFRERNPDVKLDRQLVPLAHNRAEKLRILKNEGFEEKN